MGARHLVNVHETFLHGRTRDNNAESLLNNNERGLCAAYFPLSTVIEDTKLPSVTVRDPREEKRSYVRFIINSAR